MGTQELYCGRHETWNLDPRQNGQNSKLHTDRSILRQMAKWLFGVTYIA